MDGKLAAKATGCFSVCRINRSDIHFTRVSYNCAFCPSTFKWKRTLKDHISAVHEGKSFACTQCRYTFVNKSGLNQHVKHYHEQLPRYRCEECGKDMPIARISSDILPPMSAASDKLFMESWIIHENKYFFDNFKIHV